MTDDGAVPTAPTAPIAPRGFRIQYASDLHMEFVKARDTYLPKVLVPAVPPAQVLILAGDIGHDADGSLAGVLQYASSHWSEVVYVMGNHEFYKADGRPRRTCEEVEAAVAAVVASFPNVHLLCHSSPEWLWPGSPTPVVFIGSTLWAHVKPSSPAAYGMNDFRYACITPASMSSMWERDKKAIGARLAHWRSVRELSEGEDSSGLKIVVVTHHMPSLSLIAPKFLGSRLSDAFASPCDFLLEGVAAWVYGHTHDANQLMLGDCLCAVNAIGYPREATGFRPTAVLTLDTV